MKVIIEIPDDGDLTLSAHIEGETKPSQRQALALARLAMLAGRISGDLLDGAAEAATDA